MDYLILKLALSSTEGIECLPVLKLTNPNQSFSKKMEKPYGIFDSRNALPQDKLIALGFK